MVNGTDLPEVRSKALDGVVECMKGPQRVELLGEVIELGK